MRLSPLFPLTLAVLPFVACRSAEAPAAPQGSESNTSGEPQAVAQSVEPSTTPATEASAAVVAPVQDGDQSTDDYLATEEERLQLLQERRVFLAGKFVENGDRLLDEADLGGALGQYAQALEVDPTNTRARDGMRRVEGLMGDTYAQADDFLVDAAGRVAVKRAQARMQAESSSLLGDQAMRDGEYTAAVESYREALLILGYNPAIAGGSLDETILRNKLESARALGAEQVLAQEQHRLQAAEEARMEAEAASRRYRDERLGELYQQAWDSFQRQKYSVAESLAEQILLEDPGNTHATQMRDIAKDARHAKTDSDTRELMHREWLRTMDELNQLATPQTQAIVFDDIDRWREVNKRKPITFPDAVGGSSSEKEAILAVLRERRVRPQFGDGIDGEPLAEVADFLQQVTGINFLLSAQVRDELDEDETAVNLTLPETSVLNVLDLIVAMSPSVRWKIDQGVIKFVHPDEMVGGQVLRMYEVRDLIHPVPDFPGAEINVIPSGGIEPPDEEIEEREALVVTADSLSDLILTNVVPESWENDPANSIQITEAGTMVVYQSVEVHEKIQSLLDDLREATGIMVDIQARFLDVQDSFLEDIGVDWRGLGAPGGGTNAFINDYGSPSVQPELGAEIGQDTSFGVFYQENQTELAARIENLYDTDLGDTDVLTASGGLSVQWTYLSDLQVEMILRAVSKSQRSQVVTAPRVLVFNTARSNLTVLNQVAYVQDYDVEIAQASSIADPIVAVVPDGVVLDVRPVVSADRRFITLELRPTVANLRRPIAEFSTSLATQGTVTIQLPNLEIARVRTSVPMPDGGTILLGGLKLHQQDNFNSGVPILNKIPILQALFDRKGQYTQNRKLLILLKASIVIPPEHEPTPAQMGAGWDMGAAE